MTEKTLSPKAHEILDAAERRVRRGGFKAASFRDVAADVGIKSASVHYHFPQKTDLGQAVVERYADRVLAALGAADNPAESPETRLQRLIGVYENGLKQDDAVCLCAILGAAIKDLPDEVADTVRSFYRQLLGWTEQALEHGPTSAIQASRIISALQGAMILAITLDEPGHISNVGKALRDEFRNQGAGV